METASRRYIDVTTANKTKLAKLFKCTETFVYMALTYRKDSSLARKIRYVAVRDYKGKPKNAQKPKAQKTAKENAPTMLKAVGREACRLHKLEQVWVTDDGQCFPLEGDAKAHAVNLKNSELIKVTAE